MPEPAGTVQRYSSDGVPYSEPSGEFTEDQVQAAFDKGYQAGRDSMAAEVEAVRRANIDCVDHFNALKADYDAFCMAAGVPEKVECKSYAGVIQDGKLDVIAKKFWSQ